MTPMVAAIPNAESILPFRNEKIISENVGTKACTAPFVATILTPGLVRPLTVYAAGRKSFEVMTCCEMKPAFALALIFSRLPLEQLGWEYKATQIEFAGRSDSFPIWKLTRG
jgi:hypothetical protein